MLLPTSMHATTARHAELIDHLNLTCFKGTQIISIYSKASVNASFLFKDGGK